MSQQQNYSAYFYFTITQDSQQSAQDIAEQYRLDKMYSYEFWDKEQISADGSSQFEQMCFRFDIDCEYQYIHQELLFWFAELKRKTDILNLPDDFIRTLHLVTHDSNMQGAGFHLNHELLRELAQLNSCFQLHGYLDPDDGHDYPYSTAIKTTITPPDRKEYAYFGIYSSYLNAENLQQLLPKLDTKMIWNQGERIEHPTTFKPKLKNNISALHVYSRLERSSTQLNAHLEDVLVQLMPYQAKLQQLFFNSNIDLSINATGHVENPHHRYVDAQNIQRLFTLGLDLDVDYYFA